MANHFEGVSDASKWHVMVGAAKKCALAEGYTLKRVPGRGLSNMWDMTKDGKTERAAIRTTRNRWFAFPPMAGGKEWKTLDEVDLVIVATVDSQSDPSKIEVFMFPASKVRDHLNKSYSERVKAGHQIKDNFGMWISLDKDTRNVPVAAGSGIVENHKMITSYNIQDLLKDFTEEAPSQEENVEETEVIEQTEDSSPVCNTIAEVMSWARGRVAEIVAVKVEAVKLDLKIEY